MNRSRGQQNQSSQEMGSETLESILICTKQPQQEKKTRPHAEQALKCPRCESTNTKFCYYNNYSLTQPRYFCKSCRRYWTQGGTLRNVPVGGSFRKNNKKSSSSSSSTSKTSKTGRQDHPPLLHNHFPSLTYDSNHDHLALVPFSNLPMRFADHDIGNYHLHESAMNLQSLYYGDDQMGIISSGGGMMNPVDQEMAAAATIPFEELSGMGEYGNNNRVLWGFPWRFAGHGEDGDNNNMNNNMVGDYDQKVNTNWNGIGSSSNWHGLLNSPLM